MGDDGSADTLANCRGRSIGVASLEPALPVALLGLLGTLLTGVLGDRVSVVTLLNVQGCGYLLAGILVLVLLGRALQKQADPPSVIEAQEMKLA